MLRICLLLLCCSFGAITFAQRPDVKDSQDHPLLSRFPDFRIAEYQEVNFDRYVLPLAIGVDGAFTKTKTLEGKVTKINYGKSEDPRPSLFELVSNYERVLAGAPDSELLFGCDQGECGKGDKTDLVSIAAITGVTLNDFFRFGTHAYRAYRFTGEGKEYHVMLYVREEKNQIQYELHFVETELMNTDQVTLADFKKNLKETGKQAFYGIFFETGKATLLPESAAELELIATFVRENPSSEAFIVGHTDNTGSYDRNMTLSEERAQAVIQALQTDFDVNTENLRAVGVGPVAPVDTNFTEDGRARNRRVELVLGRLSM